MAKQNTQGHVKPIHCRIPPPRAQSLSPPDRNSSFATTSTAATRSTAPCAHSNLPSSSRPATLSINGREEPPAKNIPLARYRWGRMYGLPFRKELHRNVPSHWMHDDHDLLKDDASPGQKYGGLTIEQGLQIWREQIPQPDKPSRTFRWGKDLQIWLPEGREFRSPKKISRGNRSRTVGRTDQAA